jgi:hypothetical protein
LAMPARVVIGSLRVDEFNAMGDARRTRVCRLFFKY